MTLILQLSQSAGRTSTVLEDAFLAVGALCGGKPVIFEKMTLCSRLCLALEANFAPYIPPFLPYLYAALKAHEDAQLCTVAVGLIGDISRALGSQSAQYANSFMTVLLENLQSDQVGRNVKITILSTFGDIALAIGPAFEPYLAHTMNVLQQAGAVEPNPVRWFIDVLPTFLVDGVVHSLITISSIMWPNFVRASSKLTLVLLLASRRPKEVSSLHYELSTPSDI